MSIYVEVGGTSRPIQSFSVTKSLKQRATADVTLIDKTSAYTISKGQTVEIGDAFAFFGGTIDEVSVTWAVGTAVRLYRLRCVSYEQITSRRLVGQRHYDKQPAGDIIRDLVTNCLTSEGIDVTDVLDGPDVGPFDFDYATVEEAFDIIAQAAGYYWDITPALGLRFFERGTYSAPWDITTSQGKVFLGNEVRMTATFDRQNLANRVYVRIGQYVGDLASEVLHGDGATREFAVAQPIGATPTVLLNSAAQTVGILGVDTAKDFYWNLGNQTITQDDTGTLLTSGDDLQVDYQPLSSQVVLGAQDNTSISAQAAVEGLSGIYDKILEANTPTTRQGAEALAEAYIAANTQSEVVEFRTRETDLDVGQTIGINLSALGVNATFLIEELSYSQSVGGLFVANARASRGGLLPTWQQVLGGGGEAGQIIASSQSSSPLGSITVAY